MFRGVYRVFLWGVLLSSTAISADSFTTASLTIDTLAAVPHCLKPKVVGVCPKIVCDVFGCQPILVPKIQEYIPDLVVSVYSGFGEDPWLEMNATLDVADHAAGAASFSVMHPGLSLESGEANSAGNHDDDIQLKEVDVIGNPALLAFPFGIRGQATPLMPYYQSQLDALEWRSGLLEQAYSDSWVPGSNEVGQILISDWGSVYPRSGFVMQPDIAKASAVIAVRGASIATTHNAHIGAVNLDESPCPDDECETAGEIKAHSETVEWQRIVPDSPQTCESSPSDGDLSWTKGPSDHQSFAWIVWRQYTACM